MSCSDILYHIKHESLSFEYCLKACEVCKLNKKCSDYTCYNRAVEYTINVKILY